MNVLSLIVEFIAAILILTACYPLIEVSLDLNREYQENFEDIKAGDTDALEESIREPIENLLPDGPKDIVKDSIIDILREIILQKLIGKRTPQD